MFGPILKLISLTKLDCEVLQILGNAEVKVSFAQSYFDTPDLFCSDCRVVYTTIIFVVRINAVTADGAVRLFEFHFLMFNNDLFDKYLDFRTSCLLQSVTLASRLFAEPLFSINVSLNLKARETAPKFLFDILKTQKLFEFLRIDPEMAQNMLGLIKNVTAQS